MSRQKTKYRIWMFPWYTGHEIINDNERGIVFEQQVLLVMVNTSPMHILLFDICRTVCGGPVKMHSTGQRYLSISANFARSIRSFQQNSNFAGMSLQEFLMKMWR